MSAIYLDHAATTPLSRAVFESMIPYFTEHYGNPSSVHGFGRKAKQALTEARDSIASALGCSSGQLFFTSGGTESDNLAVIGVAESLRAQGKSHIVTSAVEHHAVLHACAYLENNGYSVTYVPVDAYGWVNPDDVASAIRPDTALISVMYANNEVGTLQSIREIGAIARGRGICMHTDAVQALGAVPIDLSELPVDLISFSAHKINGPKGIGLLYAGRNVPLQPMLHGGSQERKKRPGTENVAGAVGFAKALELKLAGRENRGQRMSELRAAFLSELARTAGPEAFTVNGHPVPDRRLDSIINVSFTGIDKETMLMNLDLAGIAASGGSACTSGSLEDSHVLAAMKLAQDRIGSAIRFSLGDGVTSEEIVEAAQKTGTIVNRVRKP